VHPLSSARVTLPRRCRCRPPRTRAPAPPRRPSAPQLGIDPAPHPRYIRSVIRYPFEAHASGAPRGAREYARVAEQIAEYADLTPAQMAAKVKALERDMYRAARELGFERAAAIRDQIKELCGRGLAA